MIKDSEGFTIIERLEDIPQDMSEEQAAEFWATHSYSDALLSEMEPVPLEGRDGLPPARKPVSKRISLTLEQDTIMRLKKLARKKGMGYQTLLKSFVGERLYEEEKRDGTFG